jgi:uridine phosphorylase
MKSAWYLHVNENITPENAILVGDRSRVWMIAQMLDEYEVINEDRGLLTVKGRFGQSDLIVVAFGMGAPIAAVVAHELVNLGVKRVLRLGTIMRIGNSKLGDFVIANEALGEDGTSKSYSSNNNLFHASNSLLEASKSAFEEFKINPKIGRAMTVDGFYTSMMSIDVSSESEVRDQHRTFESNGCIGIDMETAALYALGEKLRVDVCSICLVTVDGITKDKMEDIRRKDSEQILCRVGLSCLQKGERDARIQ